MNHSFINLSSILWNRLPVVIVVLSAAASMQAAQIDESKAAGIAMEFFGSDIKTRMSTGNAAYGVRLIYTPVSSRSAADAESGAEYYVFSGNDDRSFVIVSGDDAMPRIVGYSHDSSFDTSDMPVQLVGYLDRYAEAVQAVRSGDMAPCTDVPVGEAVEPLLTTRWGQAEPFNGLCPEQDGRRCVTGCVATAMAQIMKYHNFPPKGNGVTEEHGINASLDLSESVYEWDKMADSYDDGDYTAEEGAAVARLMRDIGGAVWMEYGPESGAYDGYIAPAMFKHFNYSSDIRYYKRMYYDTAVWMDMIRENLLRGEPVLYGGSGRSGHQFICDGIDADGYLHINWGWNGNSDGYFDMNVLRTDGIGIGGGDGSYNGDQDMVANIRPGDPDADNSAYTAPLMAFGLGVSRWTQIGDDGEIMEPNPMTLNFQMTVSNNTRSDMFRTNTRLCTSLYDSVGNLVESNLSEGLMVNIRRDQNAEVSGYINMYDLWNSGRLSDGEYVIRVWYMERPSSDAEFSRREFDFASQASLPVTVRSGKIYIDPTLIPTMAVEILSVSQPGAIYAGLDEQAALNIVVRNTGTQVIHPFIELYLIPEAEATDDAPDLSAYTSVGSVSPQWVYIGTDVVYEGRIYSSSIAEPGRYRVYGMYEGSIVPQPEPQYVEVSALPDGVPFIFMSSLRTWKKEYLNSYNEWMEVTMDYRPMTGYASWFDSRIAYEVWGCREDAGESTEFRLFEGTTRSMSNTSGEVSVYGTPDVGGREPGHYSFYIRCRRMEDTDWYVPERYNRCEFDLVEDPSGSVETPDAAAGCTVSVSGHDICVDGCESGALIEIWSPAGVPVRRAVAADSRHTIGMDGCPAGIYIVRVSHGDTTVVKAVIR